MTDSERLDWLDKDGRRREWTFWLGRNLSKGENTVRAYRVWPVFEGTSIREAIDAAIDAERDTSSCGEEG